MNSNRHQRRARDSPGGTMHATKGGFTHGRYTGPAGMAEPLPAGDQTRKRLVRPYRTGSSAPVEWREQLALQVVQGLAVRREIERAIEALPDAMQVCVLRYRCLACMTTEQTARALGYTAGQIKRIQAAGLAALAVPEVQE